MPVPLTYDTLPQHSRLRREVVDGVLQITAAPQEPSALMKQTVLRSAAVPAAIICLLVLMVGFAIVGGMYLANRLFIPDWLGVVLGVCFTILCVALFGLVWRIQYMSRIEQVQKSLQQSTIIAASAGRFVVETTGPLGTASHDFHAIAGQFRIMQSGVHQNIECLGLEMSDGTHLELLHGRDRAELRWAIRELTLFLSPAD